MKKHKLISSLLAAAIASSSIGMLSAIAEENPVVYTYTNDSGETVNITQSEIDAGHWNVDALGGTAPIVYEDFPAIIDDFVDDYAELQLRLKYLKTLSENDAAIICITNLNTDEIVFESAISNKFIYTDYMDIGSSYKVTLTETLDGETHEYNKLVKINNVAVAMPEYITDSASSEQTVLVGNINDLKASEFVNDEGEIEVDSSMPRYTKVASNDFEAYVNSLNDGDTYKVYTKDESGTAYYGFITKGSNEEVYMPEAEVLPWSMYYAATPMTLPSDSYVTAARVKSATKIPMDYYRDYSYSLSTSYFRVYSYELTDDDFFDGINIYLNASDSIGVQVWKASSLTATPTYCDTYTGRKGVINIDSAADLAYGVSSGQYLFFVVYFTATMEGTGIISVTPIDEYPSTDVTNFAYTAYANGGNLELSRSTYTLYNSKDVDVFYVSYTGSTQVNYRAHLYNYIEEDYDNPNETDKCMEISYYTNQAETLVLDTAPDDIITVSAGSYKSYNFVAGLNMQPFICIYNLDGNNKTSDYELRYYQR